MIRFLLVLLILVPAAPGSAHDIEVCGPAQVFFSPEEGCAKAILSGIERAMRTILVQSYSFTSAPLAGALIKAHERGVAVQVILDRSQEMAQGALGGQLKAAGIRIVYDDEHRIDQNKMMIIDKETVYTGSLNFTGACEYLNANILLVLRSSELAGIYSANWQEHQEHSSEK